MLRPMISCWHRISIFARNAYRHGLLGRFIGLAHAAARLHGVDLRDLLSARTMDEQAVMIGMAREDRDPPP